jgi:hypothetical protein
VIFGLALAVFASGLVNFGFLLQHRGIGQAVAAEGIVATLRASVRNRNWLAGQALGWMGFGGEIIAIGLAPLALVQAFLAGGLALSIPLAAWIFGHHVPRTQIVLVCLIAASLTALPIASGVEHDRFSTARLLTVVAAAGIAALSLHRVPKAATRALAAGVYYGIADVAIKADTVNLRSHGAPALVSGWTALAGVATFAGFVAFQASLRGRDAVGSISLMTALTTLVALGCGLFAFGESIGAGSLPIAAHVAAIAAVLACVPVLMDTNQRLTEADGA